MPAVLDADKVFESTPFLAGCRARAGNREIPGFFPGDHRTNQKEENKSGSDT